MVLRERGDETPTSNASSAADTSDVNLEYTHLSALQLLVAGDENPLLIHACQLSPQRP